MTTFRFNIAVCAALIASTACASDAVPSGLSVRLHEVLFTDTTARFRFIAPDVARELNAVAYADIADDFAYLCSQNAVPALEKAQRSVDEIVISIADRVTEFGQADPDATQFFEAFTVENATCIWKEF